MCQGVGVQSLTVPHTSAIRSQTRVPRDWVHIQYKPRVSGRNRDAELGEASRPAESPLMGHSFE